MRKSVRKFYELDRSYDYGDSCGSPTRNFMRTRRFIKKRAHRRLRRQSVLIREEGTV